MAGQVVAEIVSLVRYHGAHVWDAMASFTRFAKMSWVNMASLPSRSCTQELPQKGELLMGISHTRRTKRLEILTKSLEMLVAMLWERQFSELLTIDFYSN